MRGLRGRLAQPALVTGRVVLVNQALPRCAVEEAGRSDLLLSGGVRGLCLLERRPQGGTLRTVAHGRRARLTHVLLGGCDIGHEKNLSKRKLELRNSERRNLRIDITKVKAA